MDYATLYITDSSLIGSKTLDSLSNSIISYNPKSEGGVATGMIITLDEVVIDCSFMPPTEIQNHLEGLKGLVSSNIQGGVDLHYPISRIYNVVMVIGCVIKPGFDASGKALEFIKSYNSLLKSMVFCNNALWDYDWECLAALS